jgi:dTDP-4-dehydrorhamnose reductase
LRILLLGADGQVGWEARRALAPLGEVQALTRRDLDLEWPLAPGLNAAAPDVLVNAAAWTAVDAAEGAGERAHRVNAGAVGEMADWCAAHGALLVHYSTDYVFSGGRAEPYREFDVTGPLNVYGRSKLAGEDAIRASGCRHLILRTSWVYGLRGGNFARTILRRALTQDTLQVVADTRGVPTPADLIADVTAHLVRSLQPPLLSSSPASQARRLDQEAFGTPEDDGRPARGGYSGTYHLSPAGQTTWHGYACHLLEAARAAGLPVRVRPEDIAPVPASHFPAPARRPLNSLLDSRLLCQRFGLTMPDWRAGVTRWVDGVAQRPLDGA